MASNDSRKVVTAEFRLSYPNLFQAKSFNNQEAKYGCVMLFDKKIDLAKPADGQKLSLKHAAKNAAEEKWGPREKWPKGLKMPFRDGAEKDGADGYENCIFVSASSKIQPGIVDQNLKPILSEKDLYAGCYCRAELVAFAYDTSGNRGVSFALQNIQKLRDGEPFSGRSKPENAFTAVANGSDDAANYEQESDGLGF